MSKINEILDEFKGIVSGRGQRLVDGLLPTIIFILFYNFLGLNPALIGAILCSLLLAAIRILRRENLVYALGGIGAVLFAAAIAALSGSGEGFFVPGLISGGLTVVLCTASVLFNKPLVAWTSALTRRWPRADLAGRGVDRNGRRPRCDRRFRTTRL